MLGILSEEQGAGRRDCGSSSLLLTYSQQFFHCWVYGVFKAGISFAFRGRPSGSGSFRCLIPRSFVPDSIPNILADARELLVLFLPVFDSYTSYLTCLFLPVFDSYTLYKHCATCFASCSHFVNEVRSHFAREVRQSWNSLRSKIAISGQCCSRDWNLGTMLSRDSMNLGTMFVPRFPPYPKHESRDNVVPR